MCCCTKDAGRPWAGACFSTPHLVTMPCWARAHQHSGARTAHWTAHHTPPRAASCMEGTDPGAPPQSFEQPAPAFQPADQPEPSTTAPVYHALNGGESLPPAPAHAASETGAPDAGWGQQPGSDAQPQPAADGNGGSVAAGEEAALPPPPARRHRWGKPMNQPDPSAAAAEGAAAAAGEGAGGEGAESRKRKRKSRWETDESLAKAIVPAGDGSSRALIAVFPKDVTLSNGLKVRLGCCQGTTGWPCKPATACSQAGLHAPMQPDGHARACIGALARAENLASTCRVC